MSNQKDVQAIAINGISCRLPGDVDNPRKLWDFLLQGKDGQSRLPKSRFNVDAFQHPEAQRTGSVAGDGGYFLQHNPREFDNAFFGIHNLEAKYMDPQQRQLLEVVYECLEDAGETLRTVSGANIGVYVANFTSDFVLMQAKDPNLYHRYSATGFGPTILANRISHVFDLKGPSMVLDTACSSSLYALHAACVALNSGECDAAIVAGANLVQSPETYIAMAKAGVLSPTSTSHTFDASADGYGRGEGIAALFLRRLPDALLRSEPIRSVIRSTAVNSNGRTAGITLPDVTGQAAVIRKAYQAAQIDPSDTLYVEAHGTGTPVGDPIEVHALADAFQPTSARPLLVGSVKPNFGHGEAVSGLTSVIKATLALEHRIIPPSIGVTELNPNLRLKERSIDIVRYATSWPQNRDERISINSFGYGGANAHAILESAAMHTTYEHTGRSTDNAIKSTVLLPVTASSEKSLRKSIELLSAYHPQAYELADISYTLDSCRSRLPWRGFLIASASENEVSLATPSTTPYAPAQDPPEIAWVFTGQGAQWPAMGSELLSRFNICAGIIDKLDEYLQSIPHAPTWSIRSTIQDVECQATIYEPTRSQTVCSALQIAIVSLLRHWKIPCTAVVGHSSGEIGAAFAAGHISGQEGVAIAYYRGLVSEKISTVGGMIAVGLSEEAAQSVISNLSLQTQACIACVNSPTSTTISGEDSAIQTIAEKLRCQDTFVREVRTNGRAYHSHLMREVGEEYQQHLEAILLNAKKSSPRRGIKMYSSVTATIVSAAETHRIGYWRRNLESPVLFLHAVESLLSTGIKDLIELGPHPALGQPVHDIANQTSITGLTYLSTLSRNKPGDITLLQLAGQLFIRGFEVPFANINSHASRRPVGLIPAEQLAKSYFRLHDSQTASNIAQSNGSLQVALEHHRVSDRPVESDVGSEASANDEMTATSSIGNETGADQTDVSSLGDSETEAIIKKGFLPRLHRKLPTYAWDHDEALWSEPVLSSRYRNTEFKRHDLLGSRQPLISGKTSTWLSRIKLTEVAWLKDHRLGSTTIFPAAAYVTMAIEALLQVSTHAHARSPVFALERVQLLTVLVLSEGDTDGIELLTQLEPVQLSQAADSDRRWCFKIFSHTNDSSTLHASGTIGTRQEPRGIEPSYSVLSETMEEQSPRTFYNRLTLQGLCFGPRFRTITSIETDRLRVRPVSRAEVSFQAGGPNAETPESDYPIHPVTIDSVLQAAIIASCHGVVARLDGKVPVSIASIEFVLDDLPENGAPCFIDAHSEKVGFSAVMLGGELTDSSGRVLMKMQDVRAINYQEVALAPRSTLERNPALRVMWKPDIRKMSSKNLEQFGAYSARFAQYLPESWVTTEQAYLAAIVDLLTHQNGRTTILEIGKTENSLSKLLEKLSMSHAPKHFRSFSRGSLTFSSRLQIEHPSEGNNYDIVVLNPTASHIMMRAEDIQSLERLLSTQGSIVFCGDYCHELERESIQLEVISFPVEASSVKLNFARRREPDVSVPAWRDTIILVYKGQIKSFDETLQAAISDFFHATVQLCELSKVTDETVPAHSMIISTIELHTPLFSDMGASDQRAMTQLYEQASVLLWITGGALFNSHSPDMAIVLGLARSLMLEKPSLRMPVLDINPEHLDMETISHQVVTILRDMVTLSTPDFEYRSHEGILYISRFVPDVSFNRRFRQKQDEDVQPILTLEAGFCKLGLKNVGQVETLRFEQQQSIPNVAPGELLIRVSAVGLNAKDYYALSDKIDIKSATCALEYSGIVRATGTSSSDFRVGDRVLVMAPNEFATLQVAPEWACIKLQDGEHDAVMATLPLVFSTALYGLEHRARLSHGQTVLIHSGAGGLGLAAIQVAQMIGAEIFATVGTTEKKRFLTQTFGIPEDHIFDSHDPCFLPLILKATHGRGVDVVLNSLTRDLLHDGWEACAPFGTFVEVGKRDISEYGKLNMHIFKKAATFTAFDLTDLYWSDVDGHKQIWSNLLRRTVSLFRNKQIKAFSPLVEFPASRITDAFRHFALGTRMGKVSVRFDQQQQLSVLPLTYQTSFDPFKAYLLIGCLGGLGRSLSRWMLQQGARNFIFIGRSGTKKAAAARLVVDLRAAGAMVTVVQGSVVDLDIVTKAVNNTMQPLGGVIQASMAIHVSLFNQMDNLDWHAGLDQKVQGTWNLHHALAGKDAELDFFLLLSSITGSVGTATESNYCAANSFLDAFASYRRRLNLPALSLGLGMISEVGFLHENPDTEAALLRKGVHPFTAAELLQIVDGALTPAPSSPAAAIDDGFGAEHGMHAHILTGLELHGFQKIRDQGFVRGAKVLEDPRCTYIAGAFADDATPSDDSAGASSSSKVPREVAIALEENGEAETPGPSLISAVQAIVVGRVASLLLVNVESLQAETYLSEFGMESMLAAEFRADVFRAFGVDVPFAMLLDKRTQVKGIAEMIGKGLLQERQEGTGTK